ncbi:hypothetical protein H5410_045539 [Solanum commersonii]|uniref:Uncharacterized protein n=1 Tax=Solanum commersonii TaxID=4109 RepID=A0A9J5X9U0_SOLCO|nr:hypothetical protein H5410_045539 [Solanum commersonii]
MVTNESGVACGSYSLAFIKNLITDTTMEPYKTLFIHYVKNKYTKCASIGIEMHNYIYLDNYDNFNGCIQLHENLPSFVAFLIMFKTRKIPQQLT